VLGIVGESGSGKSTVAASIIQQLKLPGRSKGSIYFEGQSLETLDDEQIRQLRGRDIGYIAQAAMNALNPVITIEKQLKEAIKVHKKLDESSMDQRVIEVMTQVGLDTKWRFSFSHELSGGMRQRVIIAMALINRPKLIIADEPTTGLDVIVQVEIVQLLRKLQRELNISMIFISHDLPAVLSVTDQIIIMKYGHIVDRGESIEVAENSSHPYTRRLVDSIPLLKPKKGRETVLIS